MEETFVTAAMLLCGPASDIVHLWSTWTARPILAGLPGFPLRFSLFWTVTWSLGAATAVAAGLGTRSIRRGIGAGLMSVPLWVVFVAFLNDLEALTNTTSTLRPIPPSALARRYYSPILRTLGYLGAGFLCWRFPVRAWPHLSPRRIAQALRTSGLPDGGRSEGASILIGVALFPLLLLGTVALDWFIRNQAPSLINGDESRLWAHLTPYYAVMISVAAGYTEELLYRGLLLLACLAGLRRVLPRRLPSRDTVAWIGAVLLQALVFAFAHSGYGTWSHLLFAGGFGLIAGVVAWRFGIWAAITMHVLVDVFAIGQDAIQNAAWFEPFLWSLLSATLLVGLVLVVTRIRPRPQKNGGL